MIGNILGGGKPDVKNVMNVVSVNIGNTKIPDIESYKLDFRIFFLFSIGWQIFSLFPKILFQSLISSRVYIEELKFVNLMILFLDSLSFRNLTFHIEFEKYQR